MTDEVELSRVFFAWVGPRVFQEGDAEMELASSILGQVKTGRLESSLILSQQLAQEVLVGWYAQLQGSILEITITGNPGQTATQLEEAAWPVIRSLAETPVSKEELGRALRIWEAGRLRGLERFGGFGGRADMLNYYHFLAGDAGYLAKDFARMAAVTPESLQKVFAQTIRADNRVVVHVSPAGGSQ
jgi:zinc protease